MCRPLGAAFIEPFVPVDANGILGRDDGIEIAVAVHIDQGHKHKLGAIAPPSLIK